MTRVVVSFSWLVWSKRAFFLHLVRIEADRNLLNWWQEVWPMQWKIALSWISGYFTFQLFTPVLFAFYGAAVAGQMGMSLSISSALTTVAIAWVQTKAPLFGQLIARRQFVELDKVFFRVLSQVGAIAGLMAAMIWVAVVFLRVQRISWSERFLGPLPLGLLLLACCAQVVTYAFAVYLRAHKTEPLLACSIAVAVLTTISTYVLGRSFGALGIAAGYFCVMATAGMMWASLVFFSKRRTWHVVSEIPSLS
jgi:O-antigen/teichoic acid export membrane protein